MEKQCSFCRKNPASIFVENSALVPNQKCSICFSCAKIRGFSPTSSVVAKQRKRGPRYSKQEEVFFRKVFREYELIKSCISSQECPECHTKDFFVRIYQILPCPQCYKTFSSLIDDILLPYNLHYKVTYSEDIEEKKSGYLKTYLQNKMQECAEKEDFESACIYRDKIQNLGDD